MERKIDVFQSPSEEYVNLKKVIIDFQIKPGKTVYWIEKKDKYEIVDCICDEGKTTATLSNGETCFIKCPLCKDKRTSLNRLSKPIMKCGTVNNIHLSGGFSSGKSCHFIGDEKEYRNGHWYMCLEIDIQCEQKAIKKNIFDIYQNQTNAESAFQKQLEFYNDTLNDMKKCKAICKGFDECEIRNKEECVCFKCPNFKTCGCTEDTCTETLY